MPPPPPPAPASGASSVTPGKSAQVAAIEQLRHFVTGRDPIVASVPALIITLPRITGPRSRANGRPSCPCASDRTWSPPSSTARISRTPCCRRSRSATFPSATPICTASPSSIRPIAARRCTRAVWRMGRPSIRVTRTRRCRSSRSGRSWRRRSARGRGWPSRPSARSRRPSRRSAAPAENRSSVSGASVSIFVESTRRHRQRRAQVHRDQRSVAVAPAARGRFARGGRGRRAAAHLAELRHPRPPGRERHAVIVNAQRWQRLAAQQMDFVATVSHELRTPLAVIRSAAQNLSAGVVHEPARRRLRRPDRKRGPPAHRHGRAGARISGLAGQRRPRAARPVDVAGLVGEVVPRRASLLEAEHIEIVGDLADDLPPVLADEGAIRRALQNLIVNALKYGGAGGGSASTRGARARGATRSDRSQRPRPRHRRRGPGAHLRAVLPGRTRTERQIHGNGLGLSLVDGSPKRTAAGSR